MTLRTRWQWLCIVGGLFFLPDVTFGENFIELARKLQSRDPTILRPAEQKVAMRVFDEVLKKSSLPYHWNEIKDEYQYQIVTGVVTGGKNVDIIAGISFGERRGFVVVLREGTSDYVHLPIVEVSFIESLKLVTLLPGYHSQIAVGSRTRGTGYEEHGLQLLQWNGVILEKIWAGSTLAQSFGAPGQGAREKVDIKFVDLNGDGLKEIVRDGTIENVALNPKTNAFDPVGKSRRVIETYWWSDAFFSYLLFEGEVLIDDVRLFQFPSSRAPVVTRLKPGEQIGVLQERENWYTVVTKQGSRGYILRNTVKKKKL